MIAARELTIAIREANTLMLSAERLSGGENLIGGIFDRALWTGTILILILCVPIFVTMLIYRAAARRIVPRSSLEYAGPPPVNRPAFQKWIEGWRPAGQAPPRPGEAALPGLCF